MSTGHETMWKPRAIREATPEGDRVVAFRTHLPEGCLGREVVAEFSRALVSGISPLRAQRFAFNAEHGPASAVDRVADDDVAAVACRRRAEGRLHHGSLDVATRGRFDRDALRRALRFDWRAPAAPATTALDLAKARATGDRTERESDRAVEAEGLAEYKKTPDACALTSCSSTRADSCSSQTCERPGLRSAGRRSCGIAIAGIRSRSFPVSRFRHSGSGSVCIFNVIGKTSMESA